MPRGLNRRQQGGSTSQIHLSFGGGPKADVAGFQAEDAAAPSGAVANLQAALRVRQQRDSDMLHGNPTRAVGGPLPDMGWDAFFGSLQQKGERADDHGLHFKADLAGHGPGEGIGQLAIQRPNGMVEHPLLDAGVSTNSLAGPQVKGLQEAANRINNNAAERMAPRPVAKPQPVTDVAFGDPRVQQRMDARYAAHQASNKRR